MSLDVNDLMALKEVRARREERMSILRRQHAHRCAQLEQDVQQARLRAERLAHEIKGRQDKRWQVLLSGSFDHIDLLSVSVQDEADAEHVEQAEHHLQGLLAALREAIARWEEIVDRHITALRKLESWGQFVNDEGRQRAKRDALRAEMIQDDMRGARHAG
ncbi:hypothetical protein BOTU111921_10875 [Bordetella tumbae]|uniref:hypothetical protein n=1 Tax=Bordetella tumbae TaxID=1649139 RepID=UPI0039F09FBB